MPVRVRSPAPNILRLISTVQREGPLDSAGLRYTHWETGHGFRAMVRTILHEELKHKPAKINSRTLYRITSARRTASRNSSASAAR
ncbi:hypothetical protein BN2476_330057 [Paraburkholderia piptadeniae]|uniref:Uncharacterized protein n=1 Tax=Paraburkholderia piptadeniae TaxID=1701573 RepID=A0A1N7S6F8_9BURK|nr:hypothetical protein BN2476_330057 [Paraburkholderia piptadeniae]